MEQLKKQEGLSQEQIPEKNTVVRGYFWFVAHGTALKGPYSTTELKKLIDKKEISEKYFAWRDGFKEWRPLYGIEELNLEKQSDSTYPTVAVPGMHTPTGLDSQLNVRATPVYKVKFSRSRWTDLKKSEVVGLFLISLTFTLSFLYLSIHYFQNEWALRWGKRASGIPLVLGSAPEAMPLYMVDPILSAPGLKHQEEEIVAVEVRAPMDRYYPEKLGALSLDAETHIDRELTLNWDKSNTYTRMMQVQGYLDLKNPKTLKVDQLGMPYLPASPSALSKRSAHP